MKTEEPIYDIVEDENSFSPKNSSSTISNLVENLDEKKYYVLHMDVFQGKSLLEQMSYIKNILNEIYKYDKIALEENSIRSITADIDNYNLPITLFWTAVKDGMDVFTSNKSRYTLYEKYTVGKVALIMRLATMFENQDIVLPYKTEEDKKKTDMIIDECCSFALSNGKLVETTKHPDIPIALAYALELIKKDSFIINY